MNIILTQNERRQNHVGTFIALHDVGRLKTEITDAGQANIIARARAAIFACSDEKFRNNNINNKKRG